MLARRTGAVMKIDKRRWLGVAGVAAVLMLVSSCSAGYGFVTFPYSGTNLGVLRDSVQIYGTMSETGTLKLEIDSTAGASPNRVYVEVQCCGDYWETVLGDSGDMHYEGTLGTFQKGQWVTVTVNPCYTGCFAWETSSKTFNFRLSIVP
jgi:hypothetical protein